MINFLKRVNEHVNIFVYDSKDKVLASGRVVAFFTSLSLLGILIYYYGFEHSPSTIKQLMLIIRGLLAIFVIHFFLRLFYSLNRSRYFKENWFEGILILLLFLDLISTYFLNFPIIKEISMLMHIQNFETFYILFVQSYIMLFGSLELIVATKEFLDIRISPAILLVLLYSGLILLGTLLLTLPEITLAEGSMSFVNALFTAVSAACMGGLTVVDTATYFSFKGQFVLMCLIQLGGIGIVTFASFFAVFLKGGEGIRHHAAVNDLLSAELSYNIPQLLRRVILFTLVIETLGAFMIFALWDEKIAFSGISEKIFYSVFHSISAFCNSGFTLFSEGLIHESTVSSYYLQIAFGLLIIFGALGFPALRDLFGIKNLRERLSKPWKQWKTSTVIAVYGAAMLIIGGGVMFYLIEANQVLAEMNYMEAWITSFFHSINRTAGFSTIDLSILSISSLILLMFLMFVGGASGSMAGGIKTSTFFVLMLSAISTIRGRDDLEFGRRSFSYDLLNRAYILFIFSTSFILVTIVILSILQPEIRTIDIVFESVSAFSVCGLSIGITPTLYDSSKIVLVTAMFIGRIGTLTLAFALSSPSSPVAYKYPDGHILVG